MALYKYSAFPFFCLAAVGCQLFFKTLTCVG